MEPLVRIELDPLLIARLFSALIWGVFFAVILQSTRPGQFLAKSRAWLAVVIGIGVDLFIAFGSDWWTVVAVISISSISIIARSLTNEELDARRGPKSYKIIWGLEDAIELSDELTTILDDIISGDRQKDTRDLRIAQALSLAYQIDKKVNDARQGDYEPKKFK